jgi:hypothetical protein
MDVKGDNWFHLVHSYKKLSDNDMVKPLTCPDCGSAYSIIARWTKDRVIEEIPGLHCYACNSTVIPGLEVLSNIRAVVKEHSYD